MTDKTLDLSGAFGKAILKWALDTSENGRPAWRSAVEKAKSDFDFAKNPHPFVSFHEPKAKSAPKPGAREYKGVNLKLHFNGIVGNKVQGLVISNQTKKLVTKTEPDGRESEMLPQLGFTKHQRKLPVGKKLDEILELPLEERNNEAPRNERGGIYADASFILRADIALMATYHELCTHKFQNVTNGIQTEFEYKDDNGRTKLQTLHPEAQICRIKFLFTDKGIHKPTVFYDLSQKISEGKYATATVDGQEIDKHNVQEWITGGSQHVIVEHWSSVDLTTMGKNLQVYVVSLTTNHRERTEFEQGPDASLLAYAETAATADAADDALAAH